MITAEKLEIYRKFQGDDDGWVRMGCPGRGVIGGADWAEIRNLLQELALLKNGLASTDYAERIRRKLSDVTSDADTAKALLDLA